MMQDVYLIMSDNGSRTKVSAVISNKEKVAEYYNFLDSNHPDCYIREKQGNFNIKYYSLEDDVKTLKEHMYVEKRSVLN